MTSERGDLRCFPSSQAVPKIFSAGLDIMEMFGKSKEHYGEFWKAVQEMWLKLYGSSLATVAVINASLLSFRPTPSLGSLPGRKDRILIQLEGWERGRVLRGQGRGGCMWGGNQNGLLKCPGGVCCKWRVGKERRTGAGGDLRSSGEIRGAAWGQGDPVFSASSSQGSSPAGGCLMALSCDYRIMAENPKYSIGLNETQLGIIAPFW